MSASDADACGVKWCEERPEHDGPHRKRLFDSFGLDIQTGRKVIMQMWLQGDTARVALPILVIDTSETGLTWSQASRLSNVASGAIGRFGQ